MVGSDLGSGGLWWNANHYLNENRHESVYEFHNRILNLPRRISILSAPQWISTFSRWNRRQTIIVSRTSLSLSNRFVTISFFCSSQVLSVVYRGRNKNKLKREDNCTKHFTRAEGVLIEITLLGVLRFCQWLPCRVGGQLEQWNWQTINTGWVKTCVLR